MVYVAEAGDEFLTSCRRNARLRLIFDNGTESRGLLRSFQRALYKEGRPARHRTRGRAAVCKWLKAAQSMSCAASRTIRSSPRIATVIQKIGVTGGSLNARFVRTNLDPTFLFADVQILASYKLNDINRAKLETLLHRIFGLVVPRRDGRGVLEIPRSPASVFCASAGG